MLFRYFSEQVFDVKKLGILSLKMAGLTIMGLALNVVNFSSYLVNAINSPRASGDVSLLEETANNTLLSDTGYQYSTAILRLFSSDMAGTAENFRGWYNYLEAPLFYCGIICLLLVFQVFNHLSKKEKITYSTFSVFWLLVVLIPDLRHLLHLYLGEYYKVGINFFIPIGLIFMAMQALSRMESENRLNLTILIISGIGLLILLFYPYKIENIELAEPKIRNWAVFFLVTYAVLLFLFRNERYRPVAKISLLAIIFIELGYFSSVSINSRKAYSAREFKKTEGGYKDNTLPALEYVKSKDQSFFRFEKDYFSGNAMHASLNDAQAQGYFGTTLYSSYNQPYYIKFLKSVNIIQEDVESQTRWAPGLRSRPLLQTMASVKYNVSKSEKPFMLNAGYKTLNQFGDVMLMQNEYFVPFGFCYDAYMSETDFRQLSNLQKDIALLKCCVLDESSSTSEIKKNLKKLTASDTVSGFDFPVYSELVAQRKKDTLQINEFKHDRIAGDIDLDSAQLLFFSIPYDENWKAKVDDKAVEPVLVNVGFIGLPLEKGKHKIELFYTPAYFNISFAVSILATFVYILLFFVSKEFKMKTKLIGLGVFLISWAINYFIII
jgi:uncharacterized membrane protein YfhO